MITRVRSSINIIGNFQNSNAEPHIRVLNASKDIKWTMGKILSVKSENAVCIYKKIYSKCL